MWITYNIIFRNICDRKLKEKIREKYGKKC